MINEENQESQSAFHENAGRLLLRLMIAALMLPHGINKISAGVGGIGGMLENAGLPAALAYGVYVGEIVAPILIILGLFTRISALIFVVNMGFAIGLAHSGDILKLNEHGGWQIELQMLYLLGAVCILFLGPGEYAIGKKRGLFA